MKIYVQTSKAQTEEKQEPSAEDLLNKEWQEFLSQVVDSIEQRRRLLKPSAFKPKDKAK